ncbi:MAG: hypothetical protein CUN49_07865 [Candidatus Thermofonsia Clade 1 bacterium]|jgi:hypothetical protein|uniref:Uncharacterized protein n=1 Tax=Candidatus Thermofonsia Clade 1 bacterium TaxID=2364210 RepID=A0A2M8PEK4_9CHLR|nr:MAG: hypothetical protein CUN49_07865 [Candidatus Thermofonsia Clade 1 bacterium]PJF42769.1 MAG: hypothetical protein CUN50_02920 [Candidatus Thermofonsia Clade 1 bacterium]RMF52367.1 MAG: hypothetical protein D6749_05075 [Chloroflexota bacterium]
MRHLVRFTLILALALTAFANWQPVRAATIVVTPFNLQGWEVINVQPSNIPQSSFVEGPDTPPLGTGSYRVRLDQRAAMVILARRDLEGRNLTEIETISYHTYRSGSNIAHDWYINLFVSTDPNRPYANCRIDFAVPPGEQGAWFLKAATDENAYNYGWTVHHADANLKECPVTIDYDKNVSFRGMLEAFKDFPNAILRPAAQFQPVISFQTGFNGTNTHANHDAAIDAITINQTTWDFELSFEGDQRVVSPDSLADWELVPVNEGDMTSFGFVEGPGTPPLGKGSYRVQLNEKPSIMLIMNFSLIGTKLSEITTLTFHTYRSGENQRDWYVNLFVSSTGEGTADCRIDFAVDAGPKGEWTFKNATDARVFNYGWTVHNVEPKTCPVTVGYDASQSFSGIQRLFEKYPNAALQPKDPGGPVVSFNTGWNAQGSHADHDAAIDAITINTITWDFEPSSK